MKGSGVRLVAAFVVMTVCLATAGDCAIRRVPDDYPTIQAAVSACESGDTVLLANGVVYDGAGNRGVTFPFVQEVTVRSVSGPGSCIINCNSEAQAFICTDYHPARVIFEGLTIRNGLLDDTSAPCYGTGGGICIRTVDATISDCVFDNCRAPQIGGGVSAYWSECVISNCVFTENSVNPAGDGGGLAIVDGEFAILDCSFTWNTARDSGGGVHAALARGNISRCSFISNTATYHYGGGLSLTNCEEFTVSNCLFSGNSGMEGSAIYSDESTAQIEACTVAYNIPVGTAGGLYAAGNDRPVLRNCIFFSNGTSVAGETGLPAASYCDIVLPSGTYSGTGNISEDPDFIEGSSGELFLNQTTSPCINTGSGPASGICIDTLAGEFCQNSFSTAITGVLDTGTVDMGCHYVSTLVTPTPTRTPTTTPTRTPTRTPTGVAPTNTPTRTPTRTPTGGPPTNTPTGTSPVPTNTPTSTPTWTPATGTPSATPTDTPEPDCTELGCAVFMPSSDFGSGDECYCEVHVCNTGSSTYTDIPLFVILDVYGMYFFAPSFGTFDFYDDPIPPGLTKIMVLPNFSWPEGAGSASNIIWYAAMTNASMSELHGDLGSFTFGWH